MHVLTIGRSVQFQFLCENPESSFQRGSKFVYVFLVDYGRGDPKTNKSGPSSALKLNAI